MFLFKSNDNNCIYQHIIYFHKNDLKISYKNIVFMKYYMDVVILKKYICYNMNKNTAIHAYNALKCDWYPIFNSGDGWYVRDIWYGGSLSFEVDFCTKILLINSSI